MADLSASANRIHLEQLELQACVGVTEDERARPQPLIINLTIWPHSAFEQLQDDINRTINYVELHRSARELVGSRDWKLIETIASELASNVLVTFPLKAVEVEVRKFVLPNTEYVSATVRKGTSS